MKSYYDNLSKYLAYADYFEIYNKDIIGLVITIKRFQYITFFGSGEKFIYYIRSIRQN